MQTLPLNIILKHDDIKICVKNHIPKLSCSNYIGQWASSFDGVVIRVNIVLPSQNYIIKISKYLNKTNRITKYPVFDFEGVMEKNNKIVYNGLLFTIRLPSYKGRYEVWSHSKSRHYNDCIPIKDGFFVNYKELPTL